MRLFAEFAYLQFLDVLTTIAFLMLGVSEANPFVRWVLEQGPNPFVGLLAVKMLAVSLAAFCLWQSRLTLLRRVNVFFAFLVAYNLVAIIIASMALQA